MCTERTCRWHIWCLVWLSWLSPVSSFGSDNQGLVEHLRVAFHGVESFVAEDYDELPATLHRNGRTRERYDRCVESGRSLFSRVTRVRFDSEGHDVAGLVVVPTDFDPDVKYPVIVFNHGNFGDGGRLTACRLGMLTGLTGDWGVGDQYVVFAPQYRGVGGSEGTDEFGGAEVADIEGMRQLALQMPFASGRSFMVGASRGGMMTWLALKRGAHPDAVAVMCGVNDLAAEVEAQPNYQGIIDAAFPDLDTRPSDLLIRSAVQWPEAINVPALIMHGDADEGARPQAASDLASLLAAQGTPTSLVEYPGVTHCLDGVEPVEMYSTIHAWFRRWSAPDLTTYSGRSDYTAVNLEERGLNADNIATLQAAAAAAQSDSVVVIHRGQVVVDWDFGTERGPIESMSITKSVVSLLAGRLTEDEAISLQTPASTWFPEWKEGTGSEVTLEHLLSHTAGVHTEPKTTELYQADDIVAYALAQEFTSPPGASWRYNNTTANLLPAVFAAEFGAIDAWAANHLFSELDFAGIGWTEDPSGHRHGMSGLQIHPVDLAKLGELIRTRGRWGTSQLVSSAWIDELVTPRDPFKPQYGLGWWLEYEHERCVIDELLLERWTSSGVPTWFVDSARALVGREPADTQAFFQDLETYLTPRAHKKWDAMTWQAGRPDCHPITTGQPVMVSGNGYLGQYLVVLPEQELVAVRMIRWREAMPGGSSLGAFPELVKALVD